jgi:hypothetical protein
MCALGSLRSKKERTDSMKLLFKNQIMKFLGIFILTMLLSILFCKTSDTTAIELIYIFWGGVPLYTVIRKTLFIILNLMLQFVNVDLIHFYLRNEEYLSLRYGNRMIVFKKMMAKICILNATFILITTTGGFVAAWLSLSQNIVIDAQECIIFIIKVYIMSLVFTEMQILTLTLVSEAVAFVIMELFVFALSISSAINRTYFTPLPAQFSDLDNIIHLGICVVIVAAMTFILTKIVQRKEIIHAN